MALDCGPIHGGFLVAQAASTTVFLTCAFLGGFFFWLAIDSP